MGQGLPQPLLFRDDNSDAALCTTPPHFPHDFAQAMHIRKALLHPDFTMTSILRRCGLILVMFFVFLNEGNAGMFGFLKKFDVLLFPEVRGRVEQAGAPVQGLKIIRAATYDTAETQETHTDKNGVFSFPPWTTKSRTPGKPLVEDRLRQVVVAQQGGEKYVLWHYVTARVTGEAVITEKLAHLNCSLEDEEIVHHFTKVENPSFTHNISSICRW